MGRPKAPFFSFQGSVNVVMHPLYNWTYSNGVRQALQRLYRNDSNVLISDSGSLTSVNYGKLLDTSKFCLFVRGWYPWSGRLGDIINSCCVPVIISDDIVLPFQDIFDWTAISFKVPEERAKTPGYLKSFLSNADGSIGKEKEKNLSSVFRRLQYNIPPKENDILSLLIESLRRKRYMYPLKRYWR